MRYLHLIPVLAVFAINSSAHAQATPTATRGADLQVGAGYTYANSDYLPNNIGGFAFYADYDLLGRFGIEADFHQVKNSQDNDPLVPGNRFSERTYEVGGRYVRPIHDGRLAPYGKVLYGRGVINFPAHELPTLTGPQIYIDNFAYNLISFGGGLDYRLRRRINLRADFEYQHWFAHDRELPDGLGPFLFTFGAAYHFPSRGPYKMSH